MNDFRKIRRNEAHRAAHYRTGIEDKRVLVTLPVVAVGMTVADKIPFAGIFRVFEGLFVGIAVREEWKGRHLGRRLLEHADAWAKPRGYGGIMLTSVPANIRAHSLYSRMGYNYSGTYVDSEFLYIKRYPCPEVKLA